MLQSFIEINAVFDNQMYIELFQKCTTFVNVLKDFRVTIQVIKTLGALILQKGPDAVKQCLPVLEM